MKHWTEIAATFPEDDDAPLTQEQLGVLYAVGLAHKFGLEVSDAQEMLEALEQGVNPADYAPEDLDPVTGWPRWQAVRRKQAGHQRATAGKPE